MRATVAIGRAGGGAQPNEHGTWFYGRGGWCDGAAVQPWVADVAQWLRPAGQENTVEYWGWFRGAEPAPAAGYTPGYILMQSSLVMHWRGAPSSS